MNYAKLTLCNITFRSDLSYNLRTLQDYVDVKHQEDNSLVEVLVGVQDNANMLGITLIYKDKVVKVDTRFNGKYELVVYAKAYTDATGVRALADLAVEKNKEIDVVLHRLHFGAEELHLRQVFQVYADDCGRVFADVRSVKFGKLDGSPMFSLSVVSPRGYNIHGRHFTGRAELLNYVEGYVDSIHASKENRNGTQD